MQPWQGGGDMIRTVAFDGSTWNEVPYKFEAGTPDMAGAIGCAAAIAWLDAIGIAAAAAHEHALLVYGTRRLSAVPGLRIIARSEEHKFELQSLMRNSYAVFSVKNT